MDVTFGTDPSAVTWVKRAIVSLLELAADESTVKRFVMTSSNSAAHMPTPNVPVRIDESELREKLSYRNPMMERN